MLKILAIAINTCRESLRERGMLVVVVYLILLPVIGLAGGYIAVGQERKIVIDLGLALMTLFGIILGIFWGAGLVRVEIDRRLLNFLLARPLQRWQLIIGKFIGLALTQLISVALMASILVLTLLVLPAVSSGEGPRALLTGLGLSLFPVLLMVYLELLIVTALALLFAAFTSQVLAMVLTLLLTLIGRSAPELLWLAETAPSQPLRLFFRAIWYLIPNLAGLNHLVEAGYGVAIPIRLLGGQMLYGLLTLVVILMLTIIIFERRQV